MISDIAKGLFTHDVGGRDGAIAPQDHQRKQQVFERV